MVLYLVTVATTSPPSWRVLYLSLMALHRTRIVVVVYLVVFVCRVVSHRSGFHLRLDLKIIKLQSRGQATCQGLVPRQGVLRVFTLVAVFVELVLKVEGFSFFRFVRT